MGSESSELSFLRDFSGGRSPDELRPPSTALWSRVSGVQVVEATMDQVNDRKGRQRERRADLG